MNNAIEAVNLTRSFNTKKRETIAVDQISFNVASGTIFGLLGPNGAGKSTTIKMLTTILTPTSGNLRVLGHDIYKQEKLIRPKIGLLYGGEQGLYRQLNGRDNLRLFGSLFHIEKKKLESQINYWLEVVGLSEAKNTLVAHYSKGMKQRLHIARAMIHDPEVIFMDEPTLGLDPKGQIELREIIKQQKKKGKTIILTTHDMEEAEELCDEIAFIMNGKIIQQGTFSELQEKFEESDEYEIELLNSSEGLINNIKTFKVWSEEHRLENGHLRLIFKIPKTAEGNDTLKQIIDMLVPYTIYQMNKKNMDLRSIYLQLVDNHIKPNK
ncbi:ABC transporter ATP-binding protein [Viridibacillus sp. NPDC096237]|uniref:ABC transporter ATP-binding protein n=1 Tax=Viridibacillus sp. NPDC096237 TaxID=3390721 RepID=UPI003D0533F8